MKLTANAEGYHQFAATSPGLASLAKRGNIDPECDVVQGNEGWLVKV
jgi:hypothetical protein